MAIFSLSDKRKLKKIQEEQRPLTVKEMVLMLSLLEEFDEKLKVQQEGLEKNNKLLLEIAKRIEKSGSK